MSSRVRATVVSRALPAAGQDDGRTRAVRCAVKGSAVFARGRDHLVRRTTRLAAVSAPGPTPTDTVGRPQAG